jgi:acetolactate synthase-1/2/3 large subunit
MMSLIDRPQAPPHLIRIDIDPAEMRRLVPHAGVVADADAGSRALLAALRRLLGRKGAAKAAGRGLEARARIARAKSEARAAYSKVMPQLAYLDVIRKVLPREGLLVIEVSQMGFTSYFGYPVYAPRTYISEGFQGTLGFGFPTALGVKVAHPDKPVVAMTGDGGFMFALQELATATQYGIGLITLLFNNASYGNVLRDQRTHYGNRVLGSALDNPDFMLLAKAFGVAGYRVSSPAALERALAKTIHSAAPTLIEIEVAQGSEVSPWEFIHPSNPQAHLNQK